MTERFIPPHGGYQNLLSYRKAEIVYDATVYFCRRFLDKRDRTYDQMIQAARSGKQNIVEGSMAKNGPGKMNGRNVTFAATGKKLGAVSSQGQTDSAPAQP